MTRSMPKQDQLGPCVVAVDGEVDRQGYVRIRIRDRRVRAHRLAWERAHGEIPEGMAVLHRCDNPPCVRLDHLFLGTAGDNNKDRAAKGRSAPAVGVSNNYAKLDDNKVREIRARRAQGDSAISIAAAFGINRQTVYDVALRKRWQHVA